MTGPALLAAFAALALCAGAALLASWTDATRLVISNRVNAVLCGSAALFLLAACLGGALSWEAAGWHLLAGAAAFAGGSLLFFLGVWGGGDAKMLPGAVMWAGPAGAGLLLYATALAGAALCLVLIVLRRVLPEGGASRLPALRPGGGVPYGIAIAAGLAAALFLEGNGLVVNTLADAAKTGLTVI